MARVAMLVSNRHDPDPRVQKEAVSLVEAGHHVRVYAYDRMHEATTGSERRDGVEIRRIRGARRPYGDPVATAIGLREFKRAITPGLTEFAPDVIHCHDQDTCSTGLAWKRRRGTSFVFDAHDLYWTFITMGGRQAAWRRATAQLLKTAHRRYARSADLLITVTRGLGAHPGTAEIYDAWGLSPVVLWNAPPRVGTPPPLPPTFTVGYFGYVREPAMFDWLLDAIARLPAGERPALRIAGGGTEQAPVQDRIHAAARALGISAHVTGAFRPSDLPALMAECTIQYCVYPRGGGNVERAIPVKLLDSVSYGRRVLGTADTLMADFIERRQWGWTVREGDVDGLTRAMSEAARTTAHGCPPEALEKPLTWEEQSDQLVRAYERLLRTGTRPRTP